MLPPVHPTGEHVALARGEIEIAVVVQIRERRLPHVLGLGLVTPGTDPVAAERELGVDGVGLEDLLARWWLGAELTLGAAADGIDARLLHPARRAGGVRAAAASVASSADVRAPAVASASAHGHAGATTLLDRGARCSGRAIRWSRTLRATAAGDEREQQGALQREISEAHQPLVARSAVCVNRLNQARTFAV